MNINKCKCGADAFVFREVHESKLRGRWHYVACSKCQWQGDLRKTTKSAIDQWNNGYGEGYERHSSNDPADSL